MLTTPRLSLRQLTLDDAEFYLAVLNDPDFVANVGDRGVRTLSDARAHLQQGPLHDYALRGYGLWLVQRNDNGQAIGLCGLLQRSYLSGPDLGYGFLPAARGQGFALEAARACVDFARHKAITTLWAIVNPDNAPSVALLKKLGFVHKGKQTIEPHNSLVDVYSLDT